MAETLAEKLARAEAGARPAPPAPSSSRTSGTSSSTTTSSGPGGLDFGDDTAGDELSPTEKQFGEPFAWQDAVVDMLEDEFMTGAITLGWNESIAEGWFASQKLNLVNYLQDEIVPNLFGNGPNGETEGIGIGRLGSQVDFGDPTSNIQNIDTLAKFARQWLSAQSPQVRDAFFPNLSANGARPSPRGRTGGGGGGGGGLTPEQIRNQFDLDELSEAVQQQWRGVLLDRAKDPRGIAKAYVDAVVATKGEKKIDFNQFVLNRIRKDPRHKMLYANKPDSLSEAQFMQPYVNQAAQVLRPQNMGETARAGAQLGSSPEAFRERLSRSDESTGSAPFITTMESRMTELGKVFRG